MIIISGVELDDGNGDSDGNENGWLDDELRPRMILP